MAKITTKKPGTGGQTPQKEVSQPILVDPIVEPKKSVETSGVPLQIPQVSKPNIPQVKVTRSSEVKVKTFASPPPAPPIPPPLSAKSSSGRFLVAIGGVVLILVSLSRLGGAPSNYDSEFLPLDPTSREMLVRDDPAKVAMAAWKNDQPGFFGRFFSKLCIGYARSYGCSAAPLHPFEKVAEQLGIKLNFEKEEDNKVIEQTIEYKSRAFTFGK